MDDRAAESTSDGSHMNSNHLFASHSARMVSGPSNRITIPSYPEHPECDIISVVTEFMVSDFTDPIVSCAPRVAKGGWLLERERARPIVS
jgi:hypothetical protein